MNVNNRVDAKHVYIYILWRGEHTDFTAWDTNDVHFDARSTKDDPRWFMVDVRLVRKFDRCITLDDIKGNAKLQNMMLLKRGRISVQIVTDAEWKAVLDMLHQQPSESAHHE